MRLLFATFITAWLIIPSPQALALSDIAGYDWQQSIEYLQDEGVIQGYDDGTFQPNRVLNRAELTKIVIEATFNPEDFANAAADCFPDVRAADWFSKYVCFAKEQGIVKGYPDGRFHPETHITQPEALKIILESFYEDIPQGTGEWYETYFDEADYMGMSYFNRDQAATHPLTRGEMAYFVAWNMDEEETLDDQLPYDTELSDEEIASLEDAFDWEPMLPEDCYEDEEYDAEEQMCYLIEEQPYDDEDAYDEESEYDDERAYEEEETYAEDELADEEDYGEYDAWLDDEGWIEDEEGLDDFYEDEYDFEDGDAEFSDQDAYFVYDISGDTITPAKSQGDVSQLSDDTKDVRLHQAIWKRVVELIPSQYRGSNLGQLHIFSDGIDGTHAYVEPREDGRWDLGIDAEDAKEDPRELTLTIIHEFGHTLTLGVDQVDEDSAETFAEGMQHCKPRFFTGDGCAKEGSFIDAFFQRFWTGKMLIELQKMEDSGDEDLSYDLYERDASRFITEYAATSVSEDIAESFAYYVFNELPSAPEEKFEKIRFFNQFPSLVKLRSDMRRNLINPSPTLP